jgi:hypothetical protein
MNVHRARGALFKVKLPKFGYTVLVKGTGVECVKDLLYELTTYSCLLPIQGKGVPVYLGGIKVDSLLYYTGAVRIVHMIFLSFDGFPIKAPILVTLANEAMCSLQAIHELGVLQKDPRALNILVHPDRPGITWIDFERAELFSPRVALGNLSANRKRKHGFHEVVKFSNRSDLEWAKERAKEVVKATTELNRLILR